NATSTRLMTVANTGRLTDTSESHIGPAPVLEPLPHSARSGPSAAAARRSEHARRVTHFLGVVGKTYRDAVAQLDDAFGDDEVALLEPGHDLDDAESPAADLDLPLAGDAVRADMKDVGAILNLEDGPFRHDERDALPRHDLDREQHAGP